MKKVFVLLGALLCASLLCAALIAGRVSRSDYDALAQERDDLLAQVEALSQELDGAKADIASLQSYTKELVEEADGLRGELREAERQIGEQQEKIAAFVKTVEELEQQNRSTLPSLPAVPALPPIPTGESAQGVLEAFSELIELVGKPLGVR